MARFSALAVCLLACIGLGLCVENVFALNECTATVRLDCSSCGTGENKCNVSQLSYGECSADPAIVVINAPERFKVPARNATAQAGAKQSVDFRSAISNCFAERIGTPVFFGGPTSLAAPCIGTRISSLGRSK